jgi:hypothetical protein
MSDRILGIVVDAAKDDVHVMTLREMGLPKTLLYVEKTAFEKTGDPMKAAINIAAHLAMERLQMFCEDNKYEGPVFFEFSVEWGEDLRGEIHCTIYALPKGDDPCQHSSS